MEKEETNEEIESIAEKFSQFVDKLFSRAHIPDYANDAKFPLKIEFRQRLYSYRNAILKEVIKKIDELPTYQSEEAGNSRFVIDREDLKLKLYH